MFKWMLSAISLFALVLPVHAQALSGTKLLEGKDDFAKVMVEGIGKYLDRETALSVKKRAKYWKPDISSPLAYTKSLNPNRDRLRKILGIIDRRVHATMEWISGPEQPALLAQTNRFKVYQVRWSVLAGVEGEGLLLEPTNKALANVIALPDADGTPEMLSGLTAGLPAEDQIARILADNGCRVLVPVLIDRRDSWSRNPKVGRATNQPHREFIYRMAYQMGRHIIGYEVQKVLAAVDWLTRQPNPLPVAVYGYGEGGLLSYCCGALDARIDLTVVTGAFGTRQHLWQEPIYRNVWGFLREFGDAELASLIAPRRLFDATGPHPEVSGPPPAKPGRAGAAPGRLTGPTEKEFTHELLRLNKLIPWQFSNGEQYQGYKSLAFSKDAPVALLYSLFGREFKPFLKGDLPRGLAKELDPTSRHKRQFDQLVAYTQKLLPEAAAKRDDFFWKKLDTSSLEKFQKSQEPLRDYFAKEIIGELPQPTKPLNPRTRMIYDTPKFTGYEVVLDLYDGVICHGILLIPKGMKPGEKRPVVVCQHGLEGRPTDVCNPDKKTQYYNSFGAQLAERGFIVFAPQNPYIFENQFRQLVRKGNPLGLTLYAFIVRQHERILDWLTSLPFVDGTRIAFYGLSYGGKVAMRIPVLIGRYCVVICSGDFNEWIWKNITLDWGGSYMFTREYEMYEFDLGNTFNYAEMAALIAPRPFMVERGHHDGVGLDEYVAFEYAKVRRFYARLGIPERTAIEWFNGGHVINGQGTFAFLHKHLNWPAPK